jgi:nicotinamidase-related amidase
MTDASPPVDPRATALLVMDYQAGILGRVTDSAALLDRAARAIAAMRHAGGQVGYVRVAFEDADLTAMPATSAMAGAVARSGAAALHSDAPATAIDPRIAPAPGDIVVRKTRVGAFSTTDLDRQLRDRGVSTLILAGISTSGVLLSTVRDAADRDYRILVLADVSYDSDPEVHAFLTTRIFPRQARVITLAELDGVLSAGADAAP